MESGQILSARYAKAFIEWLPRDQYNAIQKDTQALITLWDQSDDFRSYCQRPVQSSAQSTQIIEQLFHRRLSAQMVRFLQFLCVKQRLMHLGTILDELEALLAKIQNIQTAWVTVKNSLSGGQVKRLQADLERRYGCQVNIKQTIEPNLMGGLKIRIGDHVLDYTVETMLNRYYNHVMEQEG